MIQYLAFRLSIVHVWRSSGLCVSNWLIWIFVSDDVMVTSFSNPNYGMVDEAILANTEECYDQEEEGLYSEVQDDSDATTPAENSQSDPNGNALGSETSGDTQNEDLADYDDDAYSEIDVKRKEASPYKEPTKGFLGYYANLEKDARDSQEREIEKAREAELKAREEEQKGAESEVNEGSTNTAKRWVVKHMFFTSSIQPRDYSGLEQVSGWHCTLWMWPKIFLRN